MQTVPFSELRIADIVNYRRKLRTVHASHAHRVSGTIQVHWTDGTANVVKADELVERLDRDDENTMSDRELFDL